MSIMTRKIVHIDEERCDGCGACVPSCAEGAIVLSGGKARLRADALCDGLGACLGECPRGAITVVEREAEPFDEAEVARQQGHGHAPAHVTALPRAAALAPPQVTEPPAACPPPPRRGLSVVSAPAGPAARAGSGPLGNWPVQLRLVPEGAPFLAGAELLVAADCVPFAYPAFHGELLAGRKVVVGCPKLDALPAYAEKLAHMLARPDGPVSVTVARMEVPCCAGITAAVRHAVEHAAAAAGRDLPVREVVIGVDGARRG